MFCKYCGASVPNTAKFCLKCGKSIAISENPAVTQNDALTPPAGTPDNGTQQAVTFEAPAQPTPSMPNVAFQNGYGLAVTAKPNKRKTLFVIIGIVAAVCIACAITIPVIVSKNMAKEKETIAQITDKIVKVTSVAYPSDDETLAVYEEYNSLSNSQKQKVENGQLIVDAYNSIQKKIDNVDALIGKIDRSNWFAEASTTQTAVKAYNNLSEKSKEYLKNRSALEEAYQYVTTTNMTINSENFNQVFDIGYSVDGKTNFGQTSFGLDGIEISGFFDHVTPVFGLNANNNYATPVVVILTPKYPNLTYSCDFYIDLHQTYNPYFSQNPKEFKLQSGNIQYNSAEWSQYNGTAGYVIYVQDNDGSGITGFDWNDKVHKMNTFNESRVEISSVSGTISYE